MLSHLAMVALDLKVPVADTYPMGYISIFREEQALSHGYSDHGQTRKLDESYPADAD